MKFQRPTHRSRKPMSSLNLYTNNAYQWYQVAELGYDSFMARHLRG